jgi:hypothetical protein
MNEKMILIIGLCLAVVMSSFAYAQQGPPTIPNLLERIAQLEQKVLALQTALAKEISDRTSADAILQTNLTQETANRTSADATLQTQINSAVPANIQALSNYVHVESGSINDLAGPYVIFEGANYHFRNGLTQTQDVNGLGNLIVGYNKKPATGYWPPDARVGSHNLIAGDWNMYTSY